MSLSMDTLTRAFKWLLEFPFSTDNIWLGLGLFTAEVFVFLAILCFIVWKIWSWIEARYMVFEGVVVGHDFVPAHTTTLFMPAGKVTVPVPQYHPDRWSVAVRGLNAWGRERVSWHGVSEAEHDRLDNGDYVDFR